MTSEKLQRIWLAALPVLTVRSGHEPRVRLHKYRTLCTGNKRLTEALAKAA